MTNFLDLAVDTRTPIDQLEPLESDPIHDARMRAIEMINRFACDLEANLRHCPISFQTKFWGISYGLGLLICAGAPMFEKARELGVSRAALSHHANKFCLSNDLPPSIYMRPEKSRENYIEARMRNLRDQSSGRSAS